MKYSDMSWDARNSSVLTNFYSRKVFFLSFLSFHPQCWHLGQADARQDLAFGNFGCDVCC